MEERIFDFLNGFLNKLVASSAFDALDFRLTADYSESISLGQKENQLLGPYNMPAISSGLSALLYVMWKDRKVSNVSLNYETMANFEDEIENWRKNSFFDEYSPEVYREDEITADDISTYKMYDDKIESIVKGEAAKFFDTINYVNGELKDISKLLSVNAGAITTRRMIFLGPKAALPAFDFKFSNSGVEFELDNMYGDYYITRRAIELCDMKKSVEKAKLFYPAFKNNLDKSEILPKQQLCSIILTPRVTDMFIKKYVMSNLYGKMVVEGQSKFSLDDFKSNERYFRDDISVMFTPNGEEYDINNIPLTYEGVYAAPTYFIKNGSLVSPMLDLKYARKADMKPTPYLCPEMFNSSNYTIKFETNEYEPLNNVIEGMYEGFVIFDVLGMHTQDHTSGDFSISSPYALRIKNGKPEGLVKISLTGNFFEILNHHNTKFMNWYGEGDAMFMRCNCS